MIPQQVFIDASAEIVAKYLEDTRRQLNAILGKSPPAYTNIGKEEIAKLMSDSIVEAMRSESIARKCFKAEGVEEEIEEERGGYRFL